MTDKMTGVKKLVSLVETGGNGLLLERTFFFTCSRLLWFIVTIKIRYLDPTVSFARNIERSLINKFFFLTILVQSEDSHLTAGLEGHARVMRFARYLRYVMKALLTKRHSLVKLFGNLEQVIKKGFPVHNLECYWSSLPFTLTRWGIIVLFTFVSPVALDCKLRLECGGLASESRSLIGHLV